MGDLGIQTSRGRHVVAKDAHDPVAQWRDLIERSKASDAGQGPSPTLFEMSDAMSAMRRSNICNRDIAIFFGWPADGSHMGRVTRYAALQGLLPAVKTWVLATPGLDLSFIYRIATKKGEEQFAAYRAAREWWENPTNRALAARARR